MSGKWWWPLPSSTTANINKPQYHDTTPFLTAPVPPNDPIPGLPGPPSPTHDADMPSLPDQDPRLLSVTDALSYLDAVKDQFRDKPEAYYQFLDIMKAFTRQVYVRVCSLFFASPYFAPALTPQRPYSMFHVFFTATPILFRDSTFSSPLVTKSTSPTLSIQTPSP